MKRLFVVFLLVGAAFAQSSARPEFEVASIRPAPPSGGGPFRVFCDGGPGTHDPGLFTCQNMNLSNLVIIAYHVDSNRLVAPDWMARPSPWFNLSATVPSNTTKEQFELMLQNLLSDRFKLSVHHENREIAQFDLVVARSGRKFKEAADSVPAADGAGDERSSTPQRPTMDRNGFPVLQREFSASVYEVFGR